MGEMTDPAVTITDVDFVAVPVDDLDAARAFYGDVLGLPCSAVYERGGPPMGAEFEAGGVTIAVVDVEAIGRPFAPHGQPIALRVDDVEAAQRALEERGVTFAMDTMDTGVCHMAIFEDPAGNALMLHRRHAGRD
jgi:predicted enzyme related to lactoylglutathione lyase